MAIITDFAKGDKEPIAYHKKEKYSFIFILQYPISKTETQDMNVILVEKEKNGKYSVQILRIKNNMERIIL